MRVNTHADCRSPWIVYTLAVWVYVGSACVRPPVYQTPRPRPVTDADRGGDTVAVGGRWRAEWAADSTRRSNAVTALRRLLGPGSVRLFDIAEVDDEQGFPIGNGPIQDFGAVVSGAAVSDLGDFQKAKAFEGAAPYGPVVAGLYVDGAPPIGRPSYQALHLTASGTYCVFLRHDARDQEDRGWRAYVVPTGGTTCTRPTSVADSLSVQFHRDPDHKRDDDYPPSVRFGEDFAGSPLIIARCGDAECYIGPRAGFTLPPRPDGAGGLRPDNKQKRVRLWHDEQRLAVPDAHGTLHPTIPAAIEPLPGIETYRRTVEFADTLRPMAWVRLDQDPGTTKYGTGASGTGMHLSQGLNLLWIAYDTRRRTWMAQLQSYDLPLPPGPLYPARIVYTNHSKRMPGIARFAWMSTDESLWVSCDQGCCQVSAFALQ